MRLDREARLEKPHFRILNFFHTGTRGYYKILQQCLLGPFLACSYCKCLVMIDLVKKVTTHVQAVFENVASYPDKFMGTT